MSITKKIIMSAASITGVVAPLATSISININSKAQATKNVINVKDESIVDSKKDNNEYLIKTNDQINFAVNYEWNGEQYIYYHTQRKGLVQHNVKTGEEYIISKKLTEPSNLFLIKEGTSLYFQIVDGASVLVMKLTGPATSTVGARDFLPIYYSKDLVNSKFIKYIDANGKSQILMLNRKGIYRSEQTKFSLNFKKILTKRMYYPSAKVYTYKGKKYLAYGDESGLRIKDLANPSSDDYVVTTANASNAVIHFYNDGTKNYLYYSQLDDKKLHVINLDNKKQGIVASKDMYKGFMYDDTVDGKKVLIIGTHRGVMYLDPATGIITKMDKDSGVGGYYLKTKLAGTTHSLYYIPNKGIKVQKTKTYVDHIDWHQTTARNIVASITFKGDNYTFMYKTDGIHVYKNDVEQEGAANILPANKLKVKKITSMVTSIYKGKINLVIAGKEGVVRVSYDKAFSSPTDITSSDVLRGSVVIPKFDETTYAPYVIINTTRDGIEIRSLDDVTMYKTIDIYHANNFIKLVKTGDDTFKLFFNTSKAQLGYITSDQIDFNNSTVAITPAYYKTGPLEDVEPGQFAASDGLLKGASSKLILIDAKDYNVKSIDVKTNKVQQLFKPIERLTFMHVVKDNGVRFLVYGYAGGEIWKLDIDNLNGGTYRVFGGSLAAKKVSFYDGFNSYMVASTRKNGLVKINFKSPKVVIYKKMNVDVQTPTTFIKNGQTYAIYGDNVNNTIVTYNFNTGEEKVVGKNIYSYDAEFHQIHVNNKNYIYFVGYDPKDKTSAQWRRYDIDTDKVELGFENISFQSFLIEGTIDGVDKIYYVSKDKNIIEYDDATKSRTTIGKMTGEVRDFQVEDHGYVYHDKLTNTSYLFYVDGKSGLKRMNLHNHTIETIYSGDINGSELFPFAWKGEQYLIFVQSEYIKTHPTVDQKIYKIDISTKEVTLLHQYSSTDPSIGKGNLQSSHFKNVYVDGELKIIINAYYDSYLYDPRTRTTTPFIKDKYTEYNKMRLITINGEQRFVYVDYESFHHPSLATIRIDLTQEYYPVPDIS